MINKILAIDTTTDACSVAIQYESNCYQEYMVEPRAHNQNIFPMLKKVLASAKCKLSEIDLIVFGAGPGSFTGLRIATGVVQGLAFSHKIPVMPISSLRTMAQQSYSDSQAKTVIVMNDARMQQVYWGKYKINAKNVMIEIMPDALSDPKELDPNDLCASDDESLCAIGDGWDIYKDRFKHDLVKRVHMLKANYYPQANTMIKLAKYDIEIQKHTPMQASHAEPVYLRKTMV